MDTHIIVDYIKKAFEATKAWFLMAWETVKTPEFWEVPQVPAPLKKSKASVKPKSLLKEKVKAKKITDFAV